MGKPLQPSQNGPERCLPPVLCPELIAGGCCPQALLWARFFVAARGSGLGGVCPEVSHVGLVKDSSEEEKG